MRLRAGMPYPHLGFGEDYIETPSTTKRGFIVPVTKEAIFFDRTHLVLSRAAEVGEMLGLNKEKRLIDLVIGVTNNYKWKGTTYNTYQTSTPWINSLATTSWSIGRTSTRPSSCSPTFSIRTRASRCLIRGTTVLGHAGLSACGAPRVLSAAELTFTAAGSTTATVAANPLSGYRVVRQPAGVSADHRLGHRCGDRQEVVVRRRFPARRSPTWKTGRSR